MKPTKPTAHLNALEYHQPIQVLWPVDVPDTVLAITTTQHTFSSLKPENKSDKALEHNAVKLFGSFNLGDHVGDDANQVQENRFKLQSYFSSETKIQWLQQVHGNTVLTIEQHQQTPLIADAIITSQKNIALAVMTADCLPILLTNTAGTEIAAIHGGWKPLSKDIIKKTLDKMSSDKNDIIAWLGPCIGPSKFEVGEEVKTVFIHRKNQHSNAFTHSNASPKKYFANLHKIATLELINAGVDKISTLPICTYHQKDIFYSYRRESTTGRMASVIAIK